MSFPTRTPQLDYATPPADWFAGNMWASHVANGLNLLFPAGERFFVRSVNHYLPELQSDELRGQVRGFVSQEGSHAREHDRFFQLLEGQGYRIRSFLNFYNRLIFTGIIPLLSPLVRLATTAACEHYTAIIAENGLRTNMLEDTPEVLRKLLSWHAAEELEHRSVAFDVLQAVNPSFGLRLLGLFIATVTISGFWVLASAMLMLQEKNKRRVLRDFVITLRTRDPQKSLFRGVGQYMRRGFHPSQNDVDTLAAEYLSRAGLPLAS